MMFLDWKSEVAEDRKSGSSMGLCFELMRDLWPGIKCHMVSETLASRPCWGFFILVGRNMVTLAS